MRLHRSNRPSVCNLGPAPLFPGPWNKNGDARMSAKRGTPDDPLEVERIEDEHHFFIEEGFRCAVCAEKFEVGDNCASIPSAWSDHPNAIEEAHAHCAVKNGLTIGPLPEVAA